MSESDPWQLYVEAFARTSRASADSEDNVIDRPGIVGHLGTDERPNGRLLITDDRALPTLRALGDVRAAAVSVVPDAGSCIDHMRRLTGYQAGDATAMVLPDLAAAGDPQLPAGLTPRTAVASPSTDQVPLAAAAAACQAADPMAADVPAGVFVSYLNSIPDAEFLAAVDSDGVIRATAAATAIGPDANIFFVTTDPGWRGRGVGTAMTATALHAARSRGATQACLNATAAGRSIYLRLNFYSVSKLAMFSRFA